MGNNGPFGDDFGECGGCQLLASLGSGGSSLTWGFPKTGVPLKHPFE